MIRNVSILLSSNLISQGVPFLMLPFLTVLYTPEQFGVYSNLVAISSILLVMSMGRYEQVQLQISDNIKKCVVLEICFFLLCCFVFLLFFFFLFSSLDDNYIFIPFLVFLYGLFFLCEKKLNSDEKYKEMSLQKILRSLSESLISILLAIYFNVEFGLVAGLVSGLILSTVFALYKVGFKYTKSSLNSYILILKEFRNFPIFNMPHAMIGSLVSYLPILLIPIYYSNETLGYYALGMKIVQTPVALLATSLYSVLTPMIAKTRTQEKSIYKAFKKVVLIQILFVCLMIVIVVLSEKLFLFIFGDNWHDAYNYIIYMLPSTMLTFIVMPYSSITNIYFKQKTALKIEVVFTVFRSLSLYLGLVYLSLKDAIILFSFTSMLCMLMTFIWYISFTTKEYKSK